MVSDPYVGDTLGGLSARMREGAFQRLQAMYPWARNPRDVAEYFRDVAEMRPWTMGGMQLSDGSGLDYPWNWNVQGSIPSFFKHNPEALLEALPLRYLKYLGLPIVIARNAPQPVRAFLFERLQGYLQHATSAYLLRELTALVRKYSQRKAPANPYEGISGYKRIGRFRFGYEDFTEGSQLRPIEVTLLEIAQAMSRAQTNKLMPSNWRNALANAITRLTPEEEGVISELLQADMSGKDEGHIYGPEAEGRNLGMPYNRRTGQWYPARRGYGFRRGRNWGGGYRPRQRRTYRRSYRRW